jgi:hypothetical protein
MYLDLFLMCVERRERKKEKQKTNFFFFPLRGNIYQNRRREVYKSHIQSTRELFFYKRRI